MSNTIDEIVNRLKKYPEAEYELNAESITVNPKNDNGFPVSLTDNGNGNFTVAFDFWHEEFDNENDALNCFAFGLSKDCRLKLTKKGNRSIKWAVESNENGKWIEGSTTGLINLNFWKKTEFDFLQNDLISSISE
ncbi:hypothetical protein [Galbibacter pacificus]|uniref:Uncharacterized protein n=1 Tax=Galbibacter pacificus TaxID=2996052 RepID=A0ABT6FWQ8_9FLAO|nr:hypothetical protein [Galbibacter pacificus]MDG3584213.1 hypothetical protein [Galbibacter pacificus]MDG3587687.1 hypothetical protein [Galbibacter pacificus]